MLLKKILKKEHSLYRFSFNVTRSHAGKFKIGFLNVDVRKHARSSCWTTEAICYEVKYNKWWIGPMEDEKNMKKNPSKVPHRYEI